MTDVPKTTTTATDPNNNNTVTNFASLLSQFITGGGAVFGQQLGGQPSSGALVRSARTPEELKNAKIDVALEKMTLEEFSIAIQAANNDQQFLDSIALFAFAGFNPTDVFKTLKACAAIAGRSAQQFTMDVVDLLAYYLRRGTTIQRRGIPNSTTEEAKARITFLVDTYRIQDNVGINAKGDNIVTMARIMNTFPEIIGSKLASGQVSIIGRTGIVPRALSFAGGAALIPTERDWDFLFDKFLDWSVTFDEVVNRLNRQAKKEPFNKENSKENQRSWAVLARTNSRHSDAFRIRFIENFCGDFKLGVTFVEHKPTNFDWTSYKVATV